jgi:hypothetical protein
MGLPARANNEHDLWRGQVYKQMELPYLFELLHGSRSMDRRLDHGAGDTTARKTSCFCFLEASSLLHVSKPIRM